MTSERKSSITPKITAYTSKTLEPGNSLKRPSDIISPPKDIKTSKKANLSSASEVLVMETNKPTSNQESAPTNFHNPIKPIMREFKLLKDTMSSQKSKILPNRKQK